MSLTYLLRIFFVDKSRKEDRDESRRHLMDAPLQDRGKLFIVKICVGRRGPRLRVGTAKPVVAFGAIEEMLTEFNLGLRKVFGCVLQNILLTIMIDDLVLKDCDKPCLLRTFALKGFPGTYCRHECVLHQVFSGAGVANFKYGVRI